MTTLKATQVPYIARISTETSFLGSGVCVSRREVLTCQHVVGRKKNVTVQVHGQTVKGTVTKVADPPSIDLALIALDVDLPTGVEPPAWSGNVANRQSCNALGFSGGKYLAAEVEVKNAQPRHLSLEAELECGMSGGALVRLIAGWPYCVGMLQKSGEIAVSRAIGSEVVVEFLMECEVALPEQPPAPKRGPAEREHELAL